MKTNNLIRDGQTRRARINPEAGLHEGLEFAYRPMLPEEVERADFEIDKQEKKEKPEGMSHVVSGELAKRLVEWSEEAKPTFESVRRLPQPLLIRAFRIVQRREASDLPDRPSGEEADEYLADLIGDKGPDAKRDDDAGN